MVYTISEAAEKTRISVSSIRYYEKEGLLPLLGRTASGARIFSNLDLDFLSRISNLKRVGFSLREIREYIHLVQRVDDSTKARIELFTLKREAILEQIKKLEEALSILDGCIMLAKENER